MAELPKIDKYRVDSILGRGAMGVVYKAYDPLMERIVAIKMLPLDILEGADRENFLQRFRGEAKAYGRLLHPNIVTCYSYDENQEKVYIVMEFVEGKTLRQLLDRKTRFALDQVREIMTQLLDALAYSHEQGVVHRDIKPANIIITNEGRVKVADFGIARLDASTVTQTGHVMGSPSYMSPEQFSGQPVDARTDVFSAGVVLYELLSGVKPFPATDLGAALYNVLYSVPEAPSRHNKKLAPSVDHVVLTALQKDPAKRFATAKIFAAELLAALAPVPPLTGDVTEPKGESKPELAPPPEKKTRQRANLAVETSTMSKRSRGWMLGSLAIIAVAVGGWFLRAPSSPSGQSAATKNSLVPATTQATKPLPQLSEVQAVLAKLPCSGLLPTIEGSDVMLQGYVRSKDDLVTLQNAVNEVRGVEKVNLQVDVLGSPYCEVVNFLAGYRAGARDLASKIALPELNKLVQYREGDKLMLELVTPDFSSYMYVDYFMLNGTVVHMLPENNRPLVKTPANKRIKIGEGGKGKQSWEISAPFGRELITIVATKQPLFDKARPEIEEVDVYLAALRGALEQANSNTITANLTFINTKPSATP